MWKRSTCFVLSMVMLGLVSGRAYGAFDILKDPALVGWWACEEGKGTVVADSSPNKRDGTAFQGSLIWGAGVYGSAIELKIPTLVQIPAINITMTQATMAGWIKPIGAQAAWAAIMMTRGSATGLNLNPDTGTNQLAYHWGDASTSWGYRPGTVLASNEWSFVAVTVDPAKAVFYLNGAQVAVNTTAHAAVNWNAPLFLGGDGSGSFDARRMTDGWLDDVSLWTRPLTVDEIKAIMKGLVKPELAAGPSPADGATDVPRDAALSWTAGQGATTHNVYLGKSAADVNSATVASPTGVLASTGQAGTTYTPATPLDYGQTYFWRIDEVGANVFKGNVWSFTVEPYAYPVKPVAATASSAQNAMGPEKTIDGSGMTGDLAGTEPTTMWTSNGTQPNWIQYEFDKAYKLYEMKVWNSNQLIEAFLGFGAKKVTVECSTDGKTWTALANVPDFSRAPGAPNYAANTTVSFGGVMAKYVKLTIASNWGGLAPQVGLAEVQFTQVPVQARLPVPANAATGVAIDTDLNWRPGREATSHKVAFGTDQAAVTAGTGAKTVTDHSFDTGAMNFGTKYYWKVDEVGKTDTAAGDVWSFTTQEYAVVDGFESYTDDAGGRIYETWIDGWTNGSGAVVGYLQAPFAERAVVNSGKQSMPLEYNNVKTPFYSEAQRVFDTAQDWTGNGATTLSLWFRGRAAGFTDNGDGTYSMSSSGTDIWNNGDQFRFAYKTLTGDGTIVARVESVANTNVWAKAGVMIRQSTDTGSTHAFMPITAGGASAGNGASFQRRTANIGASSNDDKPAPAIGAPYWVKVERKGNSFTGSISPDGKTWTQLGTAQTITMTNPVLVGLALCSHDAALTTTATFSNVSTTGTVTGAWQSAAIGVAMPTNTAAPLYLTVEDKAGKTKTVVNANASATTVTAWTQWQIPLSDLTGVSVASVKKLTIGVGDKTSPKAGAAGLVFIDDIGFGKPAK